MIEVARADRQPRRTVGNHGRAYQGFANRGDCAIWHFIRSEERIYQMAVDSVRETRNRREAVELLRLRLRAMKIRKTPIMPGPLWGTINRATLLAALVGINTQSNKRETS